MPTSLCQGEWVLRLGVWVWAKDPAEKTKHPRQVENHTYRLETCKTRTILTDLGPKEEKQMVLCHVPLMSHATYNSKSIKCMPTRAGSQPGSGLSPTQARAVPCSCPAKGSDRMLDNKANPWRHPGRGASRLSSDSRVYRHFLNPWRHPARW